METMFLQGKLVSELEINASAEKYYEVFKDKVSNLSNICPSIVQKVQVHEGDWDSHGHGSIKIWHYTIDGKTEVFKEQVEFNDEKMTVTLNGMEGDVFKDYKTFKTTYQVVRRGPKHSLAILTLEYEKLDNGSPDPYKYLDLVNDLTKNIESHLNQ